MAASTGQPGRLSYLADNDASRCGLACWPWPTVSPSTPRPPPSRCSITTPTRRLIPSILLSGIGLVLEAVIVGLLILVVGHAVGSRDRP